jgi:hypothetical protein
LRNPTTCRQAARAPRPGAFPQAELRAYLRGLVRRRAILPTGPALFRRIVLPLATAALGIACLSAPAAAAPVPAGPPTAPVVTPSTTDSIVVGTPMTMAISPGSAADQVYGYAWTWQPSANVPTYAALPACGTDGAIHFVCGSSVTVRVSPEEPPAARFTVWAFDAAGNRSVGSTVTVNTIGAIGALYPVTHQWTTDDFYSVPLAADCGVGRVTVRCVPDTVGVDAGHPNGARPLLLPPGVTWDGSGGRIPGVLTFGAGNRLPAGTPGPVVDTRQSFTAGAWLTPTAMPTGGPATAVAQRGAGGTGFGLGLDSAGHWQFRVHSAAGDAVAVAVETAGPGSPVYVAGVADAVNHELRLYEDGALAAVAGFAPATGHAPEGVATVGGRLAGTVLTERWTGQVGNPVLAQAPLTGVGIAQLAYESFFPGSSDWDLN